LRIGIASADGASDEVRIEGFDPNDAEVGAHGVESFLFADGTLLAYRDLVLNTFIVQGDSGDDTLAGTNVQDRLYGYEGNDELRAEEGSDTLTGGRNDDLLEGGAGADMYVFDRGDGIDTIIDSGAGYDANSLSFGSGIGAADVSARQDGDDLLVSYGPGDLIRIRNWMPDRAGLWAMNFADGTSLTIAQLANAPPVTAAPPDAQTVLEDQPFSCSIPADAFADPEGGGLNYSVTLANGNALPNWLAFDPLTRTFSGVPENIDVGTLEVLVKATDALGATATQAASITVVNTNDAPEVAETIADAHATEDEAFVFSMPAGVFRDVDADDVLTLSARQADGELLPAWLAFDPETGTFSGLPGNDQVGSVSIAVIAMDLAGGSATQSFTLSVGNVNDAPEAGIVLTGQLVRQGTSFVWQMPEGAFVDADADDALTYSARLSDDGVLPAWLAFDAATGTFSGMPADIGRYDIRITATDSAGAAASQTFALDVTADGNLAPTVTPDAASVTEDRRLIAWGNVLANDQDPEGNPLSVADPGIRRGEYGLLTLLPDGHYAYLLDDCSARVQGLGAGETAIEYFGYLASYGAMQSSGELAIAVKGTNDAPILAKPLANVQLAKGKAFSWQLPAGSFADPDRNDTLSYTATLANGRSLPAWLAFDAETQTFSGTVPANAKGSLDVCVVASDGHGECSTASDTFRISFGNRTVVPQGNEGVGNGVDPPPPAHDHDWNDGPNTGPGHPDCRGAEGERGDDRNSRQQHDGEENWIKSWGAGGGHGTFACLDTRIIERHCGGFGDDRRDTDAHDDGDVFRRWAAMERALTQLLADGNRPSWLEPVHGADLRGLALMSHGWQGPMRGGADPISLAAGADICPKSFRGLDEGMLRLRTE
jgi:VCBS repeat-containing protein